MTHPTDEVCRRRRSLEVYRHSGWTLLRPPRSFRLDSPQIEQPRNGCRCFVLSRTREETRRWRWLQHALHHQSVVDQRIHVAAERPVNERNEDILFDLLDGQVFHQVRTDPPVLLWRIHDLVVDPSAPGCLQQRVIEEETKTTSRFEDSRHFGNGIVHILDVFEHETGHDCGECGVRKRQLMSTSTRHMYTAISLSCCHDLIPRRVDADNESRAETHCQSGDLAFTAPHIEHTRHSVEFGGGQGQDLFDVFRICAFSESVDPPRSVVLPQTCTLALSHVSRLRGTTVHRVTAGLSFSLWPSPERPWEEVKALAVHADAGAWTTLWYADHFMANTGDESIIDGDVHECWSMIAAITAITHRIRIGSLVSPTTMRHPAVLANTAATIDRLGHGRLVLGLGAGWQINEHRAYGIDLLENKDRVDRFEEAIQIVRSLLNSDRTTFSGHHFSITDAPCQPRPLQNPLPILVGTGGPRMSRITASHADEWNTWGTLKEARPRLDAIQQSCEAIGRDPASLRTSVQALFFLVDDASVAARIAAKAPADRSIIGDVHHIAGELTAYREAGFDEVIFPDFTLGTDAGQRRETYERIATEVLPLVS